MDLNAYHKAWMSGATESEAVRAGEDAYLENMAYSAEERAAYDAMELEIYEYEKQLEELRLKELSK